MQKSTKKVNILKEKLKGQKGWPYFSTFISLIGWFILDFICHFFLFLIKPATHSFETRAKKHENGSYLVSYIQYKKLQMKARALFVVAFLFLTVSIISVTIYFPFPRKITQAVNPTNYSWNFTASGAYTYDSGLAEITSGIAQLKNLGTPSPYSTTNPTIVPNSTNGRTYTNLSGFSVTLGSGSSGNIKFQISNNGSSWYYYNGSSWTAASGYDQTNTAEEINSNISSFTSQIGTGTFFFQTFLNSDGTQQPKIDQITLTFNEPVYYLDAVSGNDTTGAGTQTSPWQTIEKVMTVGFGGTVYMAAGTYTEAGPFQLPRHDHFHFIGTNKNTTIINGGVSNVLITTDGWMSTTDLSFDSLTFNLLIDIRAPDPNTYEARGFSFTNSIINNGINIGYSQPYGTVSITNNTIKSTDGTGITIIGDNKQSTYDISNNIIYNSGIGIGITRGDTNITIKNNTIYNNSNKGISVSNVSASATIKNNIITNNGTGIWVQGSSPILTLSYNNVYSNTTNYDGISASANDISLDPLFVNASGSDFTLQVGSLSIDAGDPADSYASEPQPNGSRINQGNYGNTAQATTSLPPLTNVYVSATSGNNTTGAGSAIAPYASITTGLTRVTAGSTLHATGTFTEQVNITSGRSGTSSSPVTIQAWSGQDAPVINATGNSNGFNLNNADYITISGFTVRNATSHGVYLQNGSDNVTLTNLTVNSNGEHGIFANTSANLTTSSSTVYSNTSAGIRLDGSTTATISSNTVYNNSGANIIFNSGSNNGTASGNIVYNASTPGIQVNNSTGVTIKNNTLYNIRNSALRFDATGDLNATSKNNIVYVPTGGSFGYEINTSTLNNFTSNYNNIYIADSSSNFGYFGANRATLSLWQTATGKDANSISSDPFFINAPEANFHLQSMEAGYSQNSPSIDTGDPTESYTNEPTPSGERINQGAYGNTASAAKTTSTPIYRAPSVDTIPPTPAEDLNLNKTTSDSLELNWTEQADDGGTLGNSISKYLIKYSFSPVTTEQEFESAPTYNQSWTPKNPGTLHTETLSGLEPDKNYYVALKFCDDSNNCSKLMNIAASTSSPEQTTENKENISEPVEIIGENENQETTIETKTTEEPTTGGPEITVKDITLSLEEITNNPKPNLNGSINPAQADIKIDIIIGNKKIGETLTDKTGKFNYTFIEPLTEGKHIVRASLSGAVEPKETTSSLTIDLTPPEVPKLKQTKVIKVKTLNQEEEEVSVTLIGDKLPTGIKEMIACLKERFLEKNSSIKPLSYEKKFTPRVDSSGFWKTTFNQKIHKAPRLLVWMRGIDLAGNISGLPCDENEEEVETFYGPSVTIAVAEETSTTENNTEETKITEEIIPEEETSSSTEEIKITLTAPTVDSVTITDKQPSNQPETIKATLVISGTNSSETTSLTLIIESEPLIFIFTPDEETSWTYTVPLEIKVGYHNISAQASDKEGNISEFSSPLEFKLTGEGLLPQCQDAYDNERDGQTDYPEDSDCQNKEDNIEGFDQEAFSKEEEKRKKEQEQNMVEKMVGKVVEKIVNQPVVQTVQTKVLDNPEVEEVTKEIAAPTLAVVAVANTASAISFSSLLSYLQFLFTQPLMLLARRKKKGWGIVYNALTKKPVSLAVVRLLDRQTNKNLQTRVTDEAGRYQFIVNPGKYYLMVTKSEYLFPTTYLRFKNKDLSYTDLYHGDTIEISEDKGAINLNVPLDPKKHEKPNKKIIWDYFLTKAQRTIASSGIILAAASFIISPLPLLFGLLALHIMLYFFFRKLSLTKKPKSWGVVKDKKNKPISQAIIKIYDLEYNRLLETQVTDRRGRYSFLVGQNRYYLIVEKSGYKSHKSPVIDLRKKEGGDVIALDMQLQKI